MQRKRTAPRRGDPTLFCITNESQGTTNDLLRAACKAHGVPFVTIDPETFRFDEEFPIRGSMLYRVETTNQSKVVEHYLLLRDGVTSFYATPSHGIGKLDNVVSATMLHEHHGVPIPKTFYGLPPAQHLQEVVDGLGGFPVILKAAGGSHGVGVMRLDSLASLKSVTDYLHSGTSEPLFILRQFIDVRSSARFIVLGNRVIDSIEYQSRADDFRSNAGMEPVVAAKRFSKEVEDVAARAVKVLGWEFGGVDVLIDRKGHPYVLEVNLPCYFPRCQQLTGTDIAGMMVEYLLEKSRKSRRT